MTTELKHLLKCYSDTLIDGRFSRSEKGALKKAVKETVWNTSLIQQVRAALFDMARDSPRDFPDHWLEDALKTLPEGFADVPIAKTYFSPGDGPLNAISHLIRNAHRSIDICVFTITDDRITSVILDAYKRGIPIRVISDNHKAEDAGSDIYRLKRSGVPLRHDCTSNHMHHKFALIDGNTLITGSYNWTRSAEAKNHENILVTDHPKPVADFTKEFDRIWNEFSSCNV